MKATNLYEVSSFRKFLEYAIMKYAMQNIRTAVRFPLEHLDGLILTHSQEIMLIILVIEFSFVTELSDK